MEAKELRIGNIVDCKNKRHNEEYIVVELIASDDININFRSYHIGDLIPIPLTEEWLLKFGFEAGLPGYYYNRELVITVDGQVYFGDTEAWIAEIHFVHQLQNLYFALTGEELTA